MKRIACLLLALAMSLALASCGAPKTDPAPVAPETNGTEPSAETKLDYPTKTIEIACPYSAGGGVTGATYMATSENSGYYLGSIVPWQLTDQFVQNDIPYNEKSFEIVGVGSFDCNFIVVSPKLGISTWEEFTEMVKSGDGAVTMAMGGNWNVHDFLRLKIEDYLGSSFARMSYDGGASALAAVMAGDADCASLSISEALSAMESGDVIAVCASSPERTPLAPEVPTLDELGTGIVHGQWRAITVPAGTDPEIKAYLAEVLDQVFSDARYIEESRQAGLDPVNYTGEAAEKYVADDFSALQDLVRSFGITPDYEL